MLPTKLRRRQLLPIASVNLDIGQSFYKVAQFRWQQEGTCNFSRPWWTWRWLTYFCHLMAIFAAYCSFCRHAKRLGITTNDFCSSCRSKDDEEIIFYLNTSLSPHFLKSLTELSYIKTVAIARFILDSG